LNEETGNAGKNISGFLERAFKFVPFVPLGLKPGANEKPTW
jgi:hypothetical protein